MVNRYFASVVFIIMGFVVLPVSAYAQQVQNHSGNSRLSFEFIVSSPSRFNLKTESGIKHGTVGNSLFSGNFFYGIEANYFFRKHLSFSPAVYFSHAKTTDSHSISFIVAPPPGTITNFKDHYNFFTVSLEPKLTFSLPYQRLSFFWTFGPIFSYGSLSVQTDGSTDRNFRNFTHLSSSSSNAFGFGAYISTGIRFAITNHIGLSGELGYQYIYYPGFHLKRTYLSNRTISYRYVLNSLTPRIGISYNL